jgi:hypothetical protein
MNESLKRTHYWDEIRFSVFAFAIGTVMLFFGFLLLDIVGFIVGGGWNDHLGSWPVFGSTISVLIHGNPLSSIILLVVWAWICRLVGKTGSDGLL